MHTSEAHHKGTITRAAKDFASGQEVKWCPGCGDYAILAQAQKVLAELNKDPENIAFVSGIGCSSRFTYYVNTYGIHGIHGRPIAIASGLKIARPDLEVWVVTGDGDCLSIGGNHFLHGLRRNIDLKILMFNNRIYALTKGQYSPTSEQNKVTYSSPYGSIDYPVNPIALALGCEGSFIARTIDANLPHMNSILKSVAQHKGTSFTEIYQNCKIFNDETFHLFTNKETRPLHSLYLTDGKPLIFGKENEWGILLSSDMQPKIVHLQNDHVRTENLWIHDVKNKQKAFLLAQLGNPGYENFPTPFGIFYQQEKPTYEELLENKIKEVKAKRGVPSINKILAGSNTWTVE